MVFPHDVSLKDRQSRKQIEKNDEHDEIESDEMVDHKEYSLKIVASNSSTYPLSLACEYHIISLIYF